MDRSARPGGPADRSSERPSDDVDDLVDVLVGLALFGGRPDAAADVILEDQDRRARRLRRAGPRSAGGCRRSTPRARSSGRSPGPGPPSGTGAGRAGPCPWSSCGGSGWGRAGRWGVALRSGSSVVGSSSGRRGGALAEIIPPGGIGHRRLGIARRRASGRLAADGSPRSRSLVLGRRQAHRSRSDRPERHRADRLR